jgi:uncharacterized protein DUF397
MKLAWRKSSKSNSQGCVEVAAMGDAILVRDTKNREAGTLTFTEKEWLAFLEGISEGEFSLNKLRGLQ